MNFNTLQSLPQNIYDVYIMVNNVVPRPGIIPSNNAAALE